MPSIVPNLWFDTEGLEAAEYYCSVVPNSEVTNVLHYTEAGPGEPGTVLTVDFVLDGQRVTIINGGPHFTLDESFSFLIECEDQAEIDHYWDRFLADGGEPSQCGWLKDKYGVSWQICPKGLDKLYADDEPERTARAMQAMFGMQKLDIAALQAAADGTDSA